MSDETPRTFPVCSDHLNADWNQPVLDDACVLCRLFYLEAQESLLEEWQQRAKRAEESIADIQRPLDAQMARLNATVTKLNGEKEELEHALAAKEREVAELKGGIAQHGLATEKDTALLGAWTATHYKNYPPYINLTMVRMKGDIVLTVRLPTKDGVTESATNAVRFTRETWPELLTLLAEARLRYDNLDALDAML